MTRHGDPGYGALAYAYDGVTGVKSFATLAPLLEEIFASHAEAGRTHLDLSCGTGLGLRFFEDHAYRSVGVDASLPMLRLARGRATRIVAGDLREIPLRGTFAWITCLNDSFRVLTEQQDVRRCLSRLRGLMNDQSLFVFDVATPDMIDRLIHKGYIRYRGGTHDLILRPTLSQRGQGDTLRFFGRVGYGGIEHEIDEVHDLRIYTRDDLINALHEASMRPIEIRDFERYRNQPNSGWLFVVKTMAGGAG